MSQPNFQGNHNWDPLRDFIATKGEQRWFHGGYDVWRGHVSVMMRRPWRTFPVVPGMPTAIGVSVGLWVLWRVMHAVTGTPLPYDPWLHTYKKVYNDMPKSAKTPTGYIWDVTPIAKETPKK